MSLFGKLFRLGLLVTCILVCISIFNEHQLTKRYLEKRDQLEQSIQESFDDSVKNLSVRTLGNTTTSQSWLLSVPSGVDVEFTLDSGSEFQVLFVLPRRSKSYRGTFHLEFSEGMVYLENLDNKSKTLQGLIPIEKRPFEIKVVSAVPRSSNSEKQSATRSPVIQKRQLLQTQSNRKVGFTLNTSQGVFCRENEQIVVARLQKQPANVSGELEDTTEVYELKVSPVKQR